ncbi:ribose 5-phosphate isomerase A [Stygiolobus caldivivus]|uniref:Ribose 5-phosphate isomerase A n=1 Tax=Stygiolobus caldivivus TaxID=2824673 RepID=A0A8D5U8M2_9CREN|nr:ribose 5-phosphate isomerase A [Stygiolobus caldivivus]BCU71232.1 ribose-5-phosphate isomerase [Stygiolobus caldivivus]
MDAKQVVAEFVSPMLLQHRVIGMGTGKTVRKLIEVLDNKNMLKDKIFIASSMDTELELSKRGALVLSLTTGIKPEIYVDSFDAVTKDKIMVKGGGAALLREKLLYYFSQKSVFIGEYTKLNTSAKLSVPVEVVQTGLSYVLSELSSLGYNVKIRESNGKIGSIITDNGNAIIDAEVNSRELCEFEKKVKEIPGVVESGVFCGKKGVRDYEIILGTDQGRIEVM